MLVRKETLNSVRPQEVVNSVHVFLFRLRRLLGLAGLLGFFYFFVDSFYSCSCCRLLFLGFLSCLGFSLSVLKLLLTFISAKAISSTALGLIVAAPAVYVSFFCEADRVVLPTINFFHSDWLFRVKLDQSRYSCVFS
jgi:hypothetical protein